MNKMNDQTFYAQMAFTMGPILLSASRTELTGLYFVGQKDCPRLDGLDGSDALGRSDGAEGLAGSDGQAGSPDSSVRAIKTAAQPFDPAAGWMDGALIRNLKVPRSGVSHSDFFFGEAAVSVPSSVNRLTASSLGEIQLLNVETPAETLMLFQQLKTELGEYFAGRRRVFDVPMALNGTAFQLQVWKVLNTIPYGKVLSYGDVGRQAGLGARHSRAVGAAVGRNPISILVPCHRVVSGTGTLTGYTGGLERKVALLQLEGVLPG